MFTAALSAISELWKEPNVPSVMNGYINTIHTHTHMYTHTHTMEYYSAIKTEWNIAIFNDVDGDRLYFAKEQTLKYRKQTGGFQCRDGWIDVWNR